jgi:hypothetical protein
MGSLSAVKCSGVLSQTPLLDPEFIRHHNTPYIIHLPTRPGLPYCATTGLPLAYHSDPIVTRPIIHGPKLHLLARTEVCSALPFFFPFQQSGTLWGASAAIEVVSVAHPSQLLGLSIIPCEVYRTQPWIASTDFETWLESSYIGPQWRIAPRSIACLC